jgi:hypothetical protein
MKFSVRLLWLAVIAGGAALVRLFTFGPWWEHAGNEFAQFGPQAILWTFAWLALLIVAVLASRRSGGASPAGSRWQRGIGTLLIALAAVAVAVGQGKWFSHEPGTTYRTLPEILALPDYAGFELVRKPDRPGPYEYIGTNRGAAGEPVVGSFLTTSKSCRFSIPGKAGEEYCVVVLLPQDGGGPTYIVLSRRAASVSGNERGVK